MMFEEATTQNGCCISRDSRGEFVANYYSTPPAGNGWFEWQWCHDHTVWRKIKAATDDDLIDLP